MKLQLAALLQQKMTRKEFLQYAGSLVLVVLGVSAVLKSLQGRSTSSVRPMGYGASTYGR